MIEAFLHWWCSIYHRPFHLQTKRRGLTSIVRCVRCGRETIRDHYYD